MTTVKRKPGRPRAYDPDRALASARDVFWDAGFASSSLDDLSAAMSMTRPSLYGAFGDKEALFLRTLEAYRDGSLVLLRERLDPERPLRECLAGVYATAIEIYLGGEGPALGCFLIGTATVEAPRHPEIRHILRDSLRLFDDVVEDRLKLAIQRSELPAATDVSALAKLASGIMHSLAIRARAGEPRAVLEAIAASGVELICGGGAAVTKGRPAAVAKASPARSSR
ncbi:MAG: TetR/AcrR family transcriptional regulator [Rhodomicrobiaceae bacterium]